MRRLMILAVLITAMFACEYEGPANWRCDKYEEGTCVKTARRRCRKGCGDTYKCDEWMRVWVAEDQYKRR